MPFTRIGWLWRIGSWPLPALQMQQGSGYRYLHRRSIGLTPPDLEVLRLVADGFSNAQVAQRIGRTEGTVKVHLKNILQKLDVKDRTEAVTAALRRGFIRLD